MVPSVAIAIAYDHNAHLSQVYASLVLLCAAVQHAQLAAVSRGLDGYALLLRSRVRLVECRLAHALSEAMRLD